MAEADSEMADPSVHALRMSDLITGGIFASASLSAAPECGDGRTSSDADVYALYPPPLDTARHSLNSRVIIKPQVRSPLPSGSS
jgi:hypothetical protein